MKRFKTMKWVVLWVVASLSMCFNSCSGDKVPDERGSIKLVNQSDRAMEMKRDGGQRMVEFSCRGHWIANTDVGWLSVTPDHGDGGTTYILLSAAENPVHTKREGHVFLLSRDGRGVMLNVVQLEGDCIVVEDDVLNLNCAGGEIAVKVGSNLEYDCDIEDEWIHTSQTRAWREDVMLFNVDKFLSKGKREGRINFTSRDGRKKQSVKINQSGVTNIQKVVISIDGEYKNLSIDTIKYSFDMRMDTAQVMAVPELQERMAKGHFVDENGVFYPSVPMENVYSGDFRNACVLRYDRHSDKEQLSRPIVVETSVPCHRFMFEIYIQRNHDGFLTFDNEPWRDEWDDEFDLRLKVETFLDDVKQGEYEETMHFLPSYSTKFYDRIPTVGRLVGKVRDAKNLGKEPFAFDNEDVAYAGLDWRFYFNNTYGQMFNHTSDLYGFYYDNYDGNKPRRERYYNNPWSNWPEFPPYDPDMR